MIIALKFRNALAAFITFVSIANCFGQPNDKKLTIIKDATYIKWFTQKNYEMWVPKSNDLMLAEEILKQAIKNDEFYFLETKEINELKQNYYRQYLCYINEKGEKLIFINSMCKIPELVNDRNKLAKLDWKNEMTNTAHGGSCYWNAKINLSTHEYSDLMINFQE